MANYASNSQLEDVAAQCIHYNPQYKESDLSMNLHISCNTCTNWDGERCRIGVFDKILTGFDQG